MQDLYELQMQLENKYSKRLATSRIRSMIDNEDILVLTQLGMAEGVATAMLLAVLENSKNKPIQGLISRLASLLDIEPEEVIQKDYVMTGAKSGIYTIIQSNEGSLYIKNNVFLPHAQEQELAQTTVLPPLLVEPKSWTSNSNGGYYSIKHSAILGNKNHHEGEICLPVLNKLQSVGFKLDRYITDTFKDVTSYDKKKVQDVVSDIGDNEFYFMWQYDKRGRMYSKGYELILQSSEYHKATLNFAKAEVCTEEGLEEIVMWIANTAGYDKLSWTDRLAKGYELIASKVSTIDSNVTIDLDGIAEPILFTKAVMAYLDALDGMPVSLPVMWDCTASGLQILAALTGCETTATKVNLVDTGKREDVYSYVVNLMNNELSANDAVDRNTAKKPFMTHWYNSVATPKKAFNENQLKAFYKAISKGFTGPSELLEAIPSIWKDTAEHRWTMPDGFEVVLRHSYNETLMVTLEDDVTFEYTKSVLGASGSYTHLMANLTHSFDAMVARELIRRCPFEVVHIHDSFVCHPNNAKKMRSIFKDIMIDLAKKDYLSSILSQISGEDIKIKKLCDDLDVKMQS
ncbi:MAG: hypothetical protein JHC33_12155, partial [Ignisphaera sp.]|nr:hypothetical protein [Ignisphaera sp.]